jgi:hypothetical protein
MSNGKSRFRFKKRTNGNAIGAGTIKFALSEGEYWTPILAERAWKASTSRKIDSARVKSLSSTRLARKKAEARKARKRGEVLVTLQGEVTAFTKQTRINAPTTALLMELYRRAVPERASGSTAGEEANKFVQLTGLKPETAGLLAGMCEKMRSGKVQGSFEQERETFIRQRNGATVSTNYLLDKYREFRVGYKQVFDSRRPGLYSFVMENFPRQVNVPASQAASFVSWVFAVRARHPEIELTNQELTERIRNALQPKVKGNKK